MIVSRASRAISAVAIEIFIFAEHNGSKKWTEQSKQVCTMNARQYTHIISGQ